MHPKCANSVVISGLSFRNTFIGTGQAASVLLRANGLRKRSFHLVGPPFMAGKIFPHLHELLPAKRYEYCNLVSGWVGSHEHVEDGCKSTCVKFGAETSTERYV